jgi:hypothetical protein
VHRMVVNAAGHHERADASVHRADRENGVAVLTYLLMADARADVRRSPACAKGADSAEPRLVLEEDAGLEVPWCACDQAPNKLRESPS